LFSKPLGEKGEAYSLLVGTPAGKKPLGRPSRLWENNITVGLTEEEWAKKDHMLLAQGTDKCELLFAQ
jgi:hypothetical protein